MTNWKNIDGFVHHDTRFHSFEFNEEDEVVIHDKTGGDKIIIRYEDIDDIFQQGLLYVMADKLYSFDPDVDLVIIFKRKLAVYKRHTQYLTTKYLLKLGETPQDNKGYFRIAK